jgi:signal transduction histidine kinase
LRQANEDLRRHVEVLSILNRISRVVSTAAYVPSALQVVGKIVLDVLKASTVTISYLDSERQSLMALTEVKRSPDGEGAIIDSAPGRVIALQDDFIARQVIEGRHIVVLPRTLISPSLTTAWAKVQAAGTHALIALPLQAGGNIVGVMTIGACDPGRTFMSGDVSLAQTISSAIAPSVETARLLAQEQRQRLMAESLREVVSALASSLDQATVIRTIFKQLRRVIQYNDAAIYLRERGTLVVAEVSGNRGSWIGRRLQLAKDWPPQRVFNERQPIVVTDTARYPEWQAWRPNQDVLSWMGAPLVIGSKSIGILAVCDRRRGTYNADDLHVLQLFAHHAAIAIDNARRYQRAHVVAADEERSRLARELHDSVTQALFSGSLIADVLPQLYRVNPQEAWESLLTLGKLMHGALAEMRTLLLELRPADLHSARLDTIIGQLSRATTLRMPVEVNVSLDSMPPLPPNVQLALYRITQEALNNVGKHARASKVDITLKAIPPVTAGSEGPWRGILALTVADDGIGFDQNSLPNGHIGMASMHERAKLIKAYLGVKSAPGQGTEVTLTWPRQRSVGRGRKQET